MRNVRAQDSLAKIHPAIACAHKNEYKKRLSEEDIIFLCDLFLKPGLHYISFSSIAEGRRTINSFVNLLKYYRTVGYIDRDNRAAQGMNLYEMFVEYADRKELKEALDAFFVEDFVYDFIWIVYSRFHVTQTFIRIFLDHVLEYNIDQKIPIIFINS
jgi:hypothetical protein